ncbi:uncharacterized protein LOC110822276 [Carica papaya]|uniref:uncharacterized protein LOC110822276 n=1 Tax=Carica papaya TaxID=3649 RepID=UPI000B8CA7DE|nr:uncharacterized protein LOC110822276 [Carica papaya]
METPSSTRRVTRSQTLATVNNLDCNSNCNNNIPMSRKIEESGQGLSARQRNTKQQQDRSALIDITNDSPIVGLAMGSLETPSSAIAKLRNSRAKKTPGSGEALLRGQVKTLLQKVEEEAEFSKLSLDKTRRFPHLQGFANSPMGLLAPTPSNTPQVHNLEAIEVASPVVEEVISQAESDEMFDGKNDMGITRSLLLDFSEKSSEQSDNSSGCSSVLSYEGMIAGESGEKEKITPDDDDASIWSIQVNASVNDDEEEEEEEDIEENYEPEEKDEDNGGEVDDDNGLLDKLCEDMNKMTVREKIMAEFAGKHTRFVYDSDDELVEEEVEEENEESGDFLQLKGWPTPKGKHLRFSMAEEEGEEE